MDCDAIFVSVPVLSCANGQDQGVLNDMVRLAKSHTGVVFIRSTVLPGTADKLGCIAMPEFLTERRAQQDMNRDSRVRSRSFLLRESNG